MALLKKLLLFIGFTIIISYNMFCLEYFLYSVYKTKLQSFVYILTITIMYILTIAMIVLINDILWSFNLFGKFNKVIGTIIILLSIGISLWLLEYIVITLGL